MTYFDYLKCIFDCAAVNAQLRDPDCTHRTLLVFRRMRLMRLIHAYESQEAAREALAGRRAA